MVDLANGQSTGDIPDMADGESIVGIAGIEMKLAIDIGLYSLSVSWEFEGNARQRFTLLRDYAAGGINGGFLPIGINGIETLYLLASESFVVGQRL